MASCLYDIISAQHHNSTAPLQLFNPDRSVLAATGCGQEFIYYNCASLVNGLVNSGSYSVTWKLEFGFWWFRARNFRITGLGKCYGITRAMKPQVGVLRLRIHRV